MNKIVLKYYPKIIDNRSPKELNVFISPERAILLNIPLIKEYKSNIVKNTPKTKTLEKPHTWYEENND